MENIGKSSQSNVNTGRFRSRQNPGTWSLRRLKLRKDYRTEMPLIITRFIGYRPPLAEAPFDPIPIPPFTWLTKVPLRYEVWAFAWIGAFTGILLIEAIMSTSTAFRDVYHTPTIITSFGASAVLLFGVIESPVAQPRNFVFGHFISAVVGTCITRLFVLNANYRGYLDNDAFHSSTFINGGLSMATSLLAMSVTGTAHPPSGATGLNAAVEAQVVVLSWRYIPVVLASSLIMLGWALIINNSGRRRYPLHWWAPGATFVYNSDEHEEKEIRGMEEAEAEEEDEEEGDMRRESHPETGDEELPRLNSPHAAMEPASSESAVDAQPGEYQKDE